MLKKSWPVYLPGSRKLTLDAASAIRDEAIGMGKPVRLLAVEFGVRVEIIQRIVKRDLYGETR